MASLVLSTNSVRFEVGDDEDAIRGKVRDALAIARCASVSEKETCGRTIEDVVSSLRAADEAFARKTTTVARGRAGATRRARDGGVRIGDAIDRGRDGDGGTRRGVVERACCSRARDGGAEKRGDGEIGRGGGGGAERRGSARRARSIPRARTCSDGRAREAPSIVSKVESCARACARRARRRASRLGSARRECRGRRSWASNKSCARRRRRV